MTRGRAWAAVLALMLVGLLSSVPIAPAQAGRTHYRITEITWAGFVPYYPAGVDLTRCRTAVDSDLSVDVDAVAANPNSNADAWVTGLSIVVTANGNRLGKVRMAYLILREDGNHFATISCRTWTDLLDQGFGGPRPHYRFRFVGTGTAHDSAGHRLGPVSTPARAFDVRIPQIAKATRVSAEIVESDELRLTGTLRAWGKKGDSYGWRPLRNRLDVLFRFGRGIRGTTTSNRDGAFAVTIPFAGSTTVRFRINGTSSDQTVYDVDSAGEISLACPEC